jgi:rSAM/selenodomain-associated transferase 1
MCEVHKKQLLLIFIKNPEPGKVKTRLAADIGKEKAFKIYRKLLSHTIKVAQKVDVKRQVWYSSFINRNDFIEGEYFDKKLQSGENLGERMYQAFKKGFDEGYRKIVIIGSDCPDITPALLQQAYEELENHDLVIGPSADGGYYLIGMKNPHSELFLDVEWSTEHVLAQTIEKSKNLSLHLFLLPELNDIDTIEDLNNAGMNDAAAN